MTRGDYSRLGLTFFVATRNSGEALIRAGFETSSTLPSYTSVSATHRFVRDLYSTVGWASCQAAALPHQKSIRNGVVASRKEYAREER
jgi:hypothetical protein